MVLTKLAIAFAFLACLLAAGISHIQSTIWWAGYDMRNCPGCKSTIDWSKEIEDDAVVSADRIRQFKEDGVVVLPSAISPNKVADLTNEVESLSDTFMTTVLTKVVLRQYSKYEHKLDTRSEPIRDWAIHGPLAKWAAQLMGVEAVRLYNCEKIYSAGADNPMGCSTAWHRDTVAAPFPTSAKSLTINIYLDDIGADAPNGDVLIYAKGSHNNLTSPPDVTDTSNLYEPKLKLGDVLVHDPHVYHTPSGRGCWNRRSLQFRYVEAPMTFTFEPNRFPHGPIPWTMAHAAGIAPHGLEEGSPLEGAWYPLAYPTTSEDEHVPIKGKPWGILNLLSVANQAQKIANGLGIGAGESCTVDSVVDADRPTPYFGFDGPITSCKDWKMVGGVPVHKDGQMILSMQKMQNGGREEDKDVEK